MLVLVLFDQVAQDIEVLLLVFASLVLIEQFVDRGDRPILFQFGSDRPQRNLADELEGSDSPRRGSEFSWASGIERCLCSSSTRESSLFPCPPAIIGVGEDITQENFAWSVIDFGDEAVLIAIRTDCGVKTKLRVL